jgi:hypothetical protein
MSYLLFIFLFFPQTDIHRISTDLAQSVIDQKLNKSSIEQLANIDADELIKELNTDGKKKAFWINVYNGLIFSQLSQDPIAYEDRSAFFSEKNIIVAGVSLSFDAIEHDILRKSTWKYSFGYITNPFKGDFESSHEVELLDPRIHFALNCGAKSCPPVRVYNHQKMEEQLNQTAKFFLLESSVYHNAENTVLVTALFNWFRGDFDGREGIIKVLSQLNIIPENSAPALTYKHYDWTLDIANFVESN